MERVDGSPSAPEEHHAVRYYRNDTALARIVAEFLHEGFDRGHPGIVIASASQRAEILRELTERKCDIVSLARSHDLVFLDGQETLYTFMTDGKPDARKFMDRMGQAIRSVCRTRTDCTVRIFGQMVDVLWQQGERDAAVRLEKLWNQLAQTQEFSLLCAYAIGNFYKDAGFKGAPHKAQP